MLMSDLMHGNGVSGSALPLFLPFDTAYPESFHCLNSYV
jgi:hypothetical protein